MPRIKLPDGNYANFPDDMPTADIEAALAERDAAAAPAPAPAERSVLTRTLEGAKTGLKIMRDEMFPPGNPVNALSMGTVGQDDTLARQADVAQSRADLPSLGTAGLVGSKIPEVAATLLPVARTGKVLTGAMSRLGRAAPIAGDVAANVAYEAGKSGLSGGDVFADAAAGGLGAGIGHGVGGLIQHGARPIMAKSARTLVDAGIIPSFGQMGGRTLSKGEDIATFLPVVGTALSRSRNVAQREYSRAEVNQALKPLGLSTKEFGEDAVTSAYDAISRSYNEVVPKTFIQAIDAQNAIVKSNLDFQRMPLLTEPQIKQVNKYIDEKIQPELSLSQQTGNRMPGRTAKDIDTELGAYARKYLESSNPADHEMGAAFRSLQNNLRDALQSNDPKALATLKKSNEAFRKLLPAEKASSASREIGEFTPEHMRKAAESLGIDLGGRGGLNRAGRELLTSGNNSFRTAAQVGGGLASGAGFDLMLTGGGIAAAHGLTSRPVRKLVAQGAGGVPVLGAGLRKLPFTLSQLGARVGANQGEENAP